jgi:hypothetical protein
MVCAELRNGRLQRPPGHNSVTLRDGNNTFTRNVGVSTPNSIIRPLYTNSRHCTTITNTCEMPETQWQGNRRTEALTWGQDFLLSPIRGAINFSCRGPPCVRRLWVGNHSHNQWNRAVTSYIWPTPYDVFAPQKNIPQFNRTQGRWQFSSVSRTVQQKVSFWTLQKQTRPTKAPIFTLSHINC